MQGGGMAIPSDAVNSVNQGIEPSYSVREILAWFGNTRRGVKVLANIHGALAESHLETEPSFETTYLDEHVKIKRAGGPTDDDIVRGGTVDDPVIRVTSVAAAHRSLISVSRTESIERAVTLMLEHNYSQLPVMGNPEAREVDGIFSWRSLCVQRASGRNPSRVQDAMESAEVVNHDDDLAHVVQRILLHDVVLVRAKDRKFQGILTILDIAAQFQALAEPFLLVGEIEKHVRRLIDGRFTHQQLKSIRQVDDGSTIATVADLTFGEYVRLVQSEENWLKLGLAIDRAEFVRVLDRVREIRNDVMHFDPDGLDDRVRVELQDAKRLLTGISPEPAPRPQ
jgi:predicted transcriptional regulator